MATRLAELPSTLPPLDWSLVILLASLAVLSLLAAWIVQHPGWRRWYVVTAITEGALMFLAIHVLNHLSRWEELEIFSVAAGTPCWWPATSAGIASTRARKTWSPSAWGRAPAGGRAPGDCRAGASQRTGILGPNELGMLAAGVLLLATGFMFQIRSTTLAGASLLAIYLVTLVLYINMIKHVQTAAIWMTIGGA